MLLVLEHHKKEGYGAVSLGVWWNAKVEGLSGVRKCHIINDKSGNGKDQI